MNVVELRGIERRSYEAKDGSGKKTFVGLHVCWQDWNGKNDDEFVGEKCENFSCPRGVDPYDLQVGQLYEVEYEIYEMRDGLHARVSGLKPMEYPDGK